MSVPMSLRPCNQQDDSRMWKRRALIRHYNLPKLLMRKCDAGWCLPVVQVDNGDEDWQENISAEIQAALGLRAHIIHHFYFGEPVRATCESSMIVVLENRDSTWDPHEPFVWMDRSQFASARLQTPAIRSALESWFDEITGVRIQPTRLPWRRRGWFDDAEKWLLNELDRCRTAAIEPVRLVKTSDRSAILRVATERGVYFMKAAPPVFHNEPIVTQQLSAMFPGLMPHVVSVDRSRGWFLMFACRGKPIYTTRSSDLWSEALRAYSHMQIGCIHQTAELLRCGCAAKRINEIPHLLRQILTETCEGTTGDFDDLSTERLVSTVAELCQRLTSFNISDTVEHGDFCGPNIYVSKAGCTVLDWSDASITHPFYSFHALTGSLTWSRVRRQMKPPSQAFIDRLQDEYLGAWQSHESRRNLRAAFLITQTLWPLQCAVDARFKFAPVAEFSAGWKSMVRWGIRELQDRIACSSLDNMNRTEWRH